MLYFLSGYLVKYFSIFNLFSYVSVRAMGGFLTVLLFAIGGGGRFIGLAQRLFRSRSRAYTPEGHRAKDNKPTMGGIFIVGTICVTMLLWCNLADPRIGIICATLLLFGAIGWWDDWRKITAHAGISEGKKFVLQLLAAGTVIGAWYWWCAPAPTIVIPVVNGWELTVPLLLLGAWWMLVVVGSSNAVNLTDGLDGLAIGSLIPTFATFSVIAYLAGHKEFASYLHMPFAGTAELAIVGAIFVGASLGFLWFNAYPAQIFMGDVGSLSLGAVLGLMAVMVRQELLLVVAGGIFVTEALSVILQVASFKYRGKRIFRMAPIHHHFELLGWPEAKIVTRFGIITTILCLIALMMLKMR